MSSRNLRVLALLICGTLLVITSWSIGQTVRLVFALKQGNWTAAARAATQAHPPVAALSAVTAHSIPDVEIWSHSLAVGSEVLAQTPALAEPATPPSVALMDARPLLAVLPAVISHTQEVATLLPRSLLAKRLLPAQLQQMLPTLTNSLTQLAPALQSMTSGTHRWLLLFQNHHELRPTGGFMGSYAILTIMDGQLTEIAVEDIYDADGQFSGYIAAPPGVQEYLSSNHGLRLPDANWDADFPTSAQTVLKYFALSDKTHIDLVAAVTLDFAQQILAVTGPIPLPDYQTTVTAETLPAVLGSHRNSYFPGSIQKKQMLTHLLTQLRLTLGTLSQVQAVQLVSLAQNAFRTKSFQVYAVNPQLQTQLQLAGVSGTLPGGQQDLIALVEANVGINKANRAVTRSFALELDQYRTSVSALFTNGNAPLDAQAIAALPASSSAHLAYVNYQRVLVPASWQVSEITFDGQTITDWHERVFHTGDQTLKEIGLLVVVPELTSRRLTLEFTTPATAQAVVLAKQAGVPPSAYSVKRPAGGLITGILEADTILDR